MVRACRPGRRPHGGRVLLPVVRSHGIPFGPDEVFLRHEHGTRRQAAGTAGKAVKGLRMMRNRLVWQVLGLDRRMRDVLTIVKPAPSSDGSAGWSPPCVTASSSGRRGGGRPAIDEGIVEAVVRMPGENTTWGYDRIDGELGNICTQRDISATSPNLHNLHTSAVWPRVARDRGGFVRARLA